MFLFGDNENMEINGQYEYMSTKVIGIQNLVIHYQSYVHTYISQYPTNIYNSFIILLHDDFKSVSGICDYWLIIEWSLVIMTYTTTVNVNHKTFQANIPLPFTVPLTYNYVLTLSQSQIYVTTYTYTDQLKTISGNNNLYYYSEYQPQQHYKVHS